jgi:hypothetical protein
VFGKRSLSPDPWNPANSGGGRGGGRGGDVTTSPAPRRQGRSVPRGWRGTLDPYWNMPGSGNYPYPIDDALARRQFRQWDFENWLYRGRGRDITRLAGALYFGWKAGKYVRGWYDYFSPASLLADAFERWKNDGAWTKAGGTSSSYILPPGWQWCTTWGPNPGGGCSGPTNKAFVTTVAACTTPGLCTTTVYGSPLPAVYNSLSRRVIFNWHNGISAFGQKTGEATWVGPGTPTTVGPQYILGFTTPLPSGDPAVSDDAGMPVADTAIPDGLRGWPVRVSNRSGLKVTLDFRSAWRPTRRLGFPVYGGVGKVTFYPRADGTTDIEAEPEAGPQPDGPPNLVPTVPGSTGEKKANVPTWIGLRIYHAITEVNDLVDVLADAIPGKPCDKLPGVQKAACVINNFSDIDWSDAAYGIVYNEYEDKIVAKINRQLQKVTGGLGPNTTQIQQWGRQLQQYGSGGKPKPIPGRESAYDRGVHSAQEMFTRFTRDQIGEGDVPLRPQWMTDL